MRIAKPVLFAGGLLVAAMSVLAPAHAAGVVTVSFVKPERFADAGDFFGNSREDNLKRLSAYLEQLGQQYLPDGQSMKIEVLDVDLAGRMKPVGSRGDVRIVNGRADWPRIQLRYTLEAGAQVLKRGEETVADMNYLFNAPHHADSDALRYEKTMLEGWFKAHFAATAAARP